MSLNLYINAKHLATKIQANEQPSPEQIQKFLEAVNNFEIGVTDAEILEKVVELVKGDVV